MEPLTGALISAGVSAAATGANIAANSNLNKKNRDWQSQEAQYNRDFQAQMYQRQLSDSIDWRTHQEQYNSPEAMMQRYVDAGINPMMVVSGSGGNQITTPMQVNGGYGSSAPSASTHRYDINISEAVQLANQTKLTNAQADVINAQAAQIRQQIRINQFEEDVVKVMIEEGYQGAVAYGRASLSEYEGKFKYYQYQTERKQLETISENLRHSRVINQFAESLLPNQRERFYAITRKAVHDANLQGWIDQMKEEGWWRDSIIQTLGAVGGMIGAVKGTGALPNTSNTRSENYSEVYTNH